MNPQQQVNETLGALLGEVGRAVWLSVRIDNKELGQVAREHRIPVWRVKEILATADFAIESASLIRISQDTSSYKPNYNGFHQSEDI